MSILWAHVKYLDDGTTENVEISQIRNPDKSPFTPSSENDFDKNKKYRVKTKLNSKDGKAHKYSAFVGKLAETKEGLENIRRIHWPVIKDYEEPSDTTSNDELFTKPSDSNVVITAKQRNAAQRKLKSKASDDSLDSFLKANPLANSNGVNEVNKPSTSKINNFEGVTQVGDEEDVEDVPQLKKKIKMLQQELRETKSVQEVINCYFKKVDSLLESKVEKIIDDKLEKFNQEQYAKLENLLSTKLSSSNSTTSSGISTDDDIEMHNGYPFKSSTLMKLKEAKRLCDWGTTLIIGTFGVDQGRKMRVRPRQPGLEKFPLTFLEASKDLYRKKLIEMKVHEEGDEGLAKKVAALPAYLADRAQDIGGRKRNVKKNNKEAQQQGQQENEVNGQEAENKREEEKENETENMSDNIFETENNEIETEIPINQW